MPKRKKKAKSIKRTTRGGVTQSVKIVIGSTAPKRKARSYLKPSNTQGHNLMTPQLISTRQEPFDLALLGNLQQRMNKIDNLNKGVYDRDFAEEAQRQLRQEVVEEKQSKEAVGQMVAEDMSKQAKKTARPKDAPPLAEAKPKRGPKSVMLPVGEPYPLGPELPTSAGISTLDPLYTMSIVEGTPIRGPIRVSAVEAQLTPEQPRTALDDFIKRGTHSQPSTLEKEASILGITSTGLLQPNDPISRQSSTEKVKKQRKPLTDEEKAERSERRKAKAKAKEEQSLKSQGTAL